MIQISYVVEMLAPITDSCVGRTFIAIKRSIRIRRLIHLQKYRVYRRVKSTHHPYQTETNRWAGQGLVKGWRYSSGCGYIVTLGTTMDKIPFTRISC